MTRPPFPVSRYALLTAALLISTVGRAQTSHLTTIHEFTGPGGVYPGGLAVGSGGVLYGTTGGGGSLRAGTVYSLTPPATTGGPWTETVLYNFMGGSDGYGPNSLIAGDGGVLYGTTYSGGIGQSGPCSPNGCGTVFALTPPSAGGVWTKTILYSFGALAGDGVDPVAIAVGSGGVLYGTTYQGGPANLGTVFALTPPVSPGAAWAETLLHGFTGADGADPTAGVIVAGSGTLYGTTGFGGHWGSGNVFSLEPPAVPGGPWTETVLFTFGSHDAMGINPSVLLAGSGGVLYGVTAGGGTSFYNGTVYSLTPPVSPGAAWTEATLYRFQGSPADGTSPSGIVMGAGGVLYGATSRGGYITPSGESGPGTLFSLTPPASAGGAWTETVLHRFSGSDGREPYSGVVKGPGGTLYGTTYTGGSVDRGTVFELQP